MIETTYIRISTAAEMLQTDVDTLLIAAAELNFSLFWLINRTLEVDEGFHNEDEDEDEHGPHYTWNPTGVRMTRRLMYIPLAHGDAAELLKSEEVTGSPKVSSNYAAYCSIWAKKRRVSPTQIVGAPD